MLAVRRQKPMSTGEAAEWLSDRLGRRIHERTLRYHAVAGSVPCLRLGSRLMFWSDELEEWVQGGGTRPAAEPAAP